MSANYTNYIIIYIYIINLYYFYFIISDINNSSFVQFQVSSLTSFLLSYCYRLFLLLTQIWDFPGQIDIFDPTFDLDQIFGGCGALIFVIDAQDDYRQALIKLHQTVTKAYQVIKVIIIKVISICIKVIIQGGKN